MEEKAYCAIQSAVLVDTNRGIVTYFFFLATVLCHDDVKRR
jgi:hypothetical protein